MTGVSLKKYKFAFSTIFIFSSFFVIEEKQNKNKQVYPIIRNCNCKRYNFIV